MFVSTRDLIVSYAAFVHGGVGDVVQVDRAFALLDRVPRARPAPGTRVLLEIGANIGTTMIPALRRGYVDRVLALEPSPDNVSLLRHNLLANDLAGRVTVIQAAASDRVGEVELAISPINSGDNRVRLNGRPYPDESEQSGGPWGSVRVPSTTVDTLVAAGDVDLATLDLVWIDTQGHEAIILAGAQSLLASDVPVLIEYCPYHLRSTKSLDRFEEIIQANYARFLDLQEGRGIEAARPTAELRALRSVYVGYEFSDLLLLKT
jgi:FkbM family methyltransferase